MNSGIASPLWGNNQTTAETTPRRMVNDPSFLDAERKVTPLIRRERASRVNYRAFSFS